MITQNPIECSSTEIDMKLKVTFPLQRKEINSQEYDVTELLCHWPLLFQFEGIILHFKLLTGIEITEIFDKFLEEKAERLVKFFGEESKTISKLSIIVNSLILKLKEKKEDFLVFTNANTTDKDIQDLNLEIPTIIALGPTMDAAQEFFVIVDGIKIVTVRTFRLAFLYYLAVYYVLNIKYPEKIEDTLEFFQRVVLGINPQLGSKAKKRRNSVNAKILKVITEISEFEWTVPEST